MSIESKAILIKHGFHQCNTDNCENLARFFINYHTDKTEFKRIYYCFDCLPEKHKSRIKKVIDFSSIQERLFDD